MDGPWSGKCCVSGDAIRGAETEYKGWSDVASATRVNTKRWIVHVHTARIQAIDRPVIAIEDLCICVRDQTECRAGVAGKYLERVIWWILYRSERWIRSIRSIALRTAVGVLALAKLKIHAVGCIFVHLVDCFFRLVGIDSEGQRQ